MDERHDSHRVLDEHRHPNPCVLHSTLLGAQKPCIFAAYWLVIELQEGTNTSNIVYQIANVTVGASGAGSYQWVVPTYQTVVVASANDYHLILRTATEQQESNQFAITPVPSALSCLSPGKQLIKGVQASIAWNTTLGYLPFVTATLYRNNTPIYEAFTNQPFTNQSNVNFFLWTVPTGAVWRALSLFTLLNAGSLPVAGNWYHFHVENALEPTQSCDSPVFSILGARFGCELCAF